MAKFAKYYDADDFDNYKRKLGKCLPPRTNILAAACHIQALFDAKKFTFGFMGGFAMLCQGYKREMPDLHIAYDDKDFDRLRSKLESDQRVRLPTGVNPLLPFKILVWTGPEYKDQGCTENASIELDLVPSGSCGTPTAGALSKNLVQLSLKTSNSQQRPFKCLNILFLIATMLSYCKARGLLWDPRKDMLYLCKNESANVQRIRTELNVKEMQELFLGTSFFSRLSMDDQRLCYRVLLDTDPPPTMAVTPPAPQASQPIQPELLLPEHKTEAKTSRSRYRNANGPRSSSSGTSNHRSTNDARPQSIDHLQDPRRLSHIVGLQSVNSAKPQPVSAAAAAKRARRSMPDLMAVHNARPALRASAQNIETVLVPRQYHVTSHVNHVPPLSTSTNQYEDRASSQLEYGGSFQPAHTRARTESEDLFQNPSADKRTASDSMKPNRTSSPGTSFQEIQSQKGSLHVVSPEGENISLRQCFQDQSVHPHEGLHLVGPGGICTAPERPHNTAQPQAQHQRHLSAPPPTISTLALELDATATAKHTFVAELSAKPIVPPLVEHMATRDHESFNISASSRPRYPRTVSVPLGSGSLPASLVAGGTSAHGHHQSLSHSEHTDESTSGFPKQTNAYRYSSFVFPKPENDEDLQTLSTASMYKAYRPSAVLNEHRGNGSLRPTDGPTHMRNMSDGSTASHDSSRLAQEYRDLLDFEEGYGSQ